MEATMVDHITKKVEDSMTDLDLERILDISQPLPENLADFKRQIQEVQEKDKAT